MDKKNCKILFMGTASFAVPSLQALVENGYNIAAVVTMPDKPMGRGHKLQAGPVKQYAAEIGLEVLQPVNLSDEVFLDRIKTLNPDLGIVVAFRMLPRVVWSMPPMGTINLHGSLLPRYRGAAPINWAVIRGDRVTGVTTFRLRHEIDTGEVLLQESVDILPTDTTGRLHDRMMMVGAGLLCRTVDGLLDGSLQGIPQEEMDIEPTSAPKIFPETGIIDWSWSATDIENLIRGLSPTPGARSELAIGGREPVLLKIWEAEVIPNENPNADVPAGTVLVDGKHLDVICGTDTLRLLTLQPMGKKAMPTAAYLNGLR